MARKDRKAKETGVLKVDFTGIEGRKSLIPDDEYLVAVEEVKLDTSESGNKNLSWKFSVIHDDDKLDGTKLYYNTSLLPQSLWNLRNLLEALEVDVPDGPLEIDFAEMTGLEMMAVVEADTYEGKKRSRITDFYPADMTDAEASEDDEASGGVTEDAINEMDEEALEELIDKHDLEVNLKKQKTIGKKRTAVIDAMEEKGLLSEEGGGDEDEKLTEEEVSEMDEKELKDLVKDHGLDVDLKKLKTLRKKANAVIDALDEKGLLADRD